jgi:hypothetical protein
MDEKSSPQDEVLIQVRVPRAFAEAIRVRTQQTGMAVSHWVRDLIARTLSQPELLAWCIDREDMGKDTPWLRDMEYGNKHPHYLLVVRNFAGELLWVEMRKGPGQGEPATETLSLATLRAISGRDFRKQILYVRGSGYWSIEHVFDVANQPGVFFLKFAGDPPFGGADSERVQRPSNRKTRAPEK